LVADDITPPEVTASLGSAYLDAGRWAEAIPLLEQTIAVVPNRPDFHVMLARALRESDQLAAADAQLALALPDNAPREASEFYETVAADIDLERGLISLAQDRLDDADASLAGALALRPDHGPTHRALAELRLRQNRRPDAAAHAARAHAAGTTLPPELAAL